MKNLVLFAGVSILLIACFDVVYEKDFYERVSGVKIPSAAKAIETFDNGEWVTTTVFEIDSLAAIKFIRDYNLLPVKKIGWPHLSGEAYLKVNKPNISINANQYFLSKTKGKNDWVYLIDMNRKMMWADVQYPDWGGR